MGEHFLHFRIVIDQSHIEVGSTGTGDRPAVDAQQLAVVDIGSNFHHTSDAFLVVQDLFFWFSGDIRKAQHRRGHQHNDKEPQYDGIQPTLVAALQGAMHQGALPTPTLMSAVSPKL